MTDYTATKSREQSQTDDRQVAGLFLDRARSPGALIGP